MTDPPALPHIAIAQDLAGSGLRLGLLAARLDPAAAEAAAARAAALDAAAQDATARLGDQPASSLPAVQAARRAYKALGTDPARYRPAAEALLRRARQGKGIAPIHPAVDANNLVSLASGISIGTYDRSRLVPPLVLRAGGAGESYRGLGRGALNLAGLPVLADAEGPFGCPTSDSERTGLGAASREVLMVLYGFGAAADPELQAGLEAALAQAAQRLQDHAGATAVAIGTRPG